MRPTAPPGRAMAHHPIDGVTGVAPITMYEQPPDAVEQPDLDDLVDRAVEGRPAAIGSLIARIHPVVVRYCRSRMSVGPAFLATADDVAQEVCMAVLTALPTYRNEGKSFLAFVYGIAAHKVADAHRAAARSRALPVADIPDAPSTDRGPEQFVDAFSTAAMVDDLLRHLPGVQQEILRLRVVAGLTAEETADALGMTAGAVRVSQHRALAKLRQRLAAGPLRAERLS